MFRHFGRTMWLLISSSSRFSSKCERHKVLKLCAFLFVLINDYLPNLLSRYFTISVFPAIFNLFMMPPRIIPLI